MRGVCIKVLGTRFYISPVPGCCWKGMRVSAYALGWIYGVRVLIHVVLSIQIVFKI
jgi:hypothetical protein